MIYRKIASRLSLCRKDVFFLVFILALCLLALWSFFNLDQKIFSLLCQKPINWHKNHWIKAFTYLGKAWLPIWLSFVWFLSTGRRRPVLITFLALIIVAVMVNPLKVGVRRPRPREVLKIQSWQEEQPYLSYHLSFPSGDAAVAFSVASVIASFVTWPFACLLLAASTGIAVLRVTAMAHYPSDVLAGAAIGIFAAWLAIQMYRRWFPLVKSRFNLSRHIAILGIFAIPLSFGLSEGFKKLAIFLKTYGLLAIGIFLATRANELSEKINVTMKLSNSERFDYILNWLRKRRTFVLKLAFLILIVEDIIARKKPHELNPFENPSGMAVIGLMLVLTGALIRFWARGHFVKGHLFTTGPYALVRHPLYLGSFLIVIGALFQLNYWLNWAIIVPLFIVFHGATIIYEERALTKRFGREWELYRAKVPAVIPSLRNLPIHRSSIKWNWKVYLATTEVKATLWFLTLPLWIEVLEDVVFEHMLGI